MTFAWAFLILGLLVTSPVWAPIAFVAGAFVLTCIIGIGVFIGVFTWIAILEFIAWVRDLPRRCRVQRKLPRNR